MPSSVDELISVVKMAYENHRKVKVLGTGHSRSSIAHSSDIYISLFNYTGNYLEYTCMFAYDRKCSFFALHCV